MGDRKNLYHRVGRRSRNSWWAISILEFAVADNRVKRYSTNTELLKSVISEMGIEPQFQKILPTRTEMKKLRDHVFVCDEPMGMFVRMFHYRERMKMNKDATYRPVHIFTSFTTSLLCFNRDDIGNNTRRVYQPTDVDKHTRAKRMIVRVSWKTELCRGLAVVD